MDVTLAQNTTTATSASYHVHSLDVLYGTISLLAGLFGLFGNIIIVKVFVKHHHSLSAKIFLTIACNDIVSSLFGAIPFSIPRLKHNEPGLFRVVAICNICGPTLNISERYSVFLIAILSVTRAWALRYPLARIIQSRVLLCMGSYFCIQLSLACLPFFRGKYYYYDNVYTLCTWTINDILDVESQRVLYQLLYYSLLIVPFFVPSLFVVVSCGLCISSIRKTVVQSNLNDKNKNRASVTIVIFTATYIILHVPLWIFLVIFLIDNHGTISSAFYDTTPFYLFMFSSKVSVFINAAMNPLIYIGRVRSMKQSFKEDLFRYRGKMSSLKKTFSRSRSNGGLGICLPKPDRGAHTLMTMKTKGQLERPKRLITRESTRSTVV